MRVAQILSIVSIVFILSSCNANTEGSFDNASTSTVMYKKIDEQTAIEMMQGDVIILDVRTIEEYDQGHIEHAILLPYNEIGDKASEILPDLDQTILIYCRTGRRSKIAAQLLIYMGYTNVYDFGGIQTDWNGAVITNN